nr:MAG TPA: Lines C-terminus [Caudoviricetes sp.]
MAVSIKNNRLYVVFIKFVLWVLFPYNISELRINFLL